MNVKVHVSEDYKTNGIPVSFFDGRLDRSGNKKNYLRVYYLHPKGYFVNIVINNFDRKALSFLNRVLCIITWVIMVDRHQSGDWVVLNTVGAIVARFATRENNRCQDGIPITKEEAQRLVAFVRAHVETYPDIGHIFKDQGAKKCERVRTGITDAGRVGSSSCGAMPAKVVVEKPAARTPAQKLDEFHEFHELLKLSNPDLF